MAERSERQLGNIMPAAVRTVLRVPRAVSEFIGGIKDELFVTEAGSLEEFARLARERGATGIWVHTDILPAGVAPGASLGGPVNISERILTWFETIGAPIGQRVSFVDRHKRGSSNDNRNDDWLREEVTAYAEGQRLQPLLDLPISCPIGGSITFNALKDRGITPFPRE